MNDQTSVFLAEWRPECAEDAARFWKELEALLLAAERRGAERMREAAAAVNEAVAARMTSGKRVPMAEIYGASLLHTRAAEIRALPLTAAGEEEAT